eukprot:8268858-Alexandrium_andersonii.AAC.1
MRALSAQRGGGLGAGAHSAEHQIAITDCHWNNSYSAQETITRSALFEGRWMQACHKSSPDIALTVSLDRRGMHLTAIYGF